MSDRPGSYTAAVPVYIDRDPEARRLEAAWRASMTPRRLSRVVTCEMRERYESGLSLERVANEFGVTRQSVYDRLSRAGVKLRPRPPRQKAQRWGGRLFTPGKDGYYRATTGDRALMHKLVWEKAHGPVPPGFEVMHLDRDLRNNRLGNLGLADKHDRSHFRKPVELKPCPVCTTTIGRHPGECKAAYDRRQCCCQKCARELMRRRGLWPLRRKPAEALCSALVGEGAA